MAAIQATQEIEQLTLDGRVKLGHDGGLGTVRAASLANDGR
jgi:hypothetical protein